MTALPLPDAPVQPATEPSTHVAERLLTALAGGLLLGVAGRRSGRAESGLRLLGAGLLAGVFARPAEHLLRAAGSRRRAAEVETTFTVEQPIREVFGFFSNLERLLPVLPEVAAIADHQDGRTDWTLRTGGGATVEWRALVSKYVPGQVIAWESVPGAPVESSGIVRFTASGDSTVVSLRITFLPRELRLYEAIRSLFSRRTDHRLREALTRTPHQLSEWARLRGEDVAAD